MMTESRTQQVNPSVEQPATVAEPVTLTYFASPTGDIVASETALRTMMKTRRWAMLCAIAMFIYSLIGGVLGTMWTLAVIFGNPGNLFQFAIIIPPNVIGAPLAFTGGLLAVRYHAAVGRANARRNTEDLERALTLQLYIWRWAGITVLALFAMPPSILALGWLLGVGQ
jgi:hypothetical protein